MSFNSYDYIIFLTTLYLLYRAVLADSRYKNFVMLLASLLFYMWWYPPYVFILLYSGLSDYAIARWMASKEKKEERWRPLMCSVVNNLGLLVIFKYLHFFCVNINSALSFTPVAWRILEPDIVLPIGISFYTFQTMSYSIDVYRGNVKPIRSMVDFMLYVSFFPQLVAGPILRAKEFVPQLTKHFKFSAIGFYTGVFFIIYGLFKKVCIADPLGFYIVDPIFAKGGYSLVEIWLGTFVYLFQAYNDFSGYSDIAIGSALILGYRVPANFDSPFWTTNPGDFWSRWHMSLTHWVRDYVFYPLNFSKRLFGRMKTNFFITMFLIGIWHGARWTYFVFGLYHGTLSVLHMLLKRRLPNPKGALGVVWKLFCWFCFFNFLALGAYIFRVDSLSDGWSRLVHGWSQSQQGLFNVSIDIYISLALALITHSIRAKHLEWLGPFFGRQIFMVKFVFLLIVFLFLFHYDYILQGHQAFIYFQF